MKTSLALITSCFLLISSMAQSQESGGRPRSGKTIYDFQEVDILGKLKSSEYKDVVEPPESRFRRMLELDESFLPNIVRSVDEF